MRRGGASVVTWLVDCASCSRVTLKCKSCSRVTSSDLAEDKGGEAARAPFPSAVHSATTPRGVMEPQGLPTTPKLPTAPQPPRPIPPLPPARTSAQPEAARAPSSATYSLPNPADIRQPTLSPLPPRLSLTTSFPLAPTPPLAPQQPDAFVATSAVEAQSEDIELPTYAHLQSQEVGNPRFGRWKGWSVRPPEC